MKKIIILLVATVMITNYMAANIDLVSNIQLLTGETASVKIQHINTGQTLEMPATANVETSIQAFVQQPGEYQIEITKINNQKINLSVEVPTPGQQ